MRFDQGWLLKDDTQSWRVHGVDIDPATRTRREEYNWIMSRLNLDSKSVLDAAAGYVPTWHELPKIMANANCEVVACDFNRRSLMMPYVRHVVRMLADITCLPFADKSFDTVVCVSVLEHLAPHEQQLAAYELLRVARRQILVTADYGYMIPMLFGGSTGEMDPVEPALNPPVYFMEILLNG